MRFLGHFLLIFYSVHGDLRCENYFKTKQSDEISYIDFQFICCANPGSELMQLLVANMGDLGDYAKIGGLIELYHSTATENLAEDIKAKFTLEDAKRDFVLSSFLLYFCQVTVKIGEVPVKYSQIGLSR